MPAVCPHCTKSERRCGCQSSSNAVDATEGFPVTPAGPTDPSARGRGGTGRRAGLKIRFRKECRFDSDRPHHASPLTIRWLTFQPQEPQSRAARDPDRARPMAQFGLPATRRSDRFGGAERRFGTSTCQCSSAEGADVTRFASPRPRRPGRCSVPASRPILPLPRRSRGWPVR